MKMSSLIGVALILLAAPAARAEILSGPYPVKVLRVIDGDTVLVELSPWFGQRMEVSVRLHGVDAPEMRSRCLDERLDAERARGFVIERLAAGGAMLVDVRKGKYFGRVIARIETPEGDLSQLLLQNELAAPYAGGARQRGDCAG